MMYITHVMFSFCFFLFYFFMQPSPNKTKLGSVQMKPMVQFSPLFNFLKNFLFSLSPFLFKIVQNVYLKQHTSEEWRIEISSPVCNCGAVSISAAICPVCLCLFSVPSLGPSLCFIRCLGLFDLLLRVSLQGGVLLFLGFKEKKKRKERKKKPTNMLPV